VTKFFPKFLLATAVMCLIPGLETPLHAQQADQDAAPASPHQPEATQQQNEAQMPASGDATTQEAKTFTGRILKENGDLVLKDLVTKVSYKLDDAAKAKQYMGKQVKVTGKLDMNTNTIQIENIELLS
jgi:predicted RNA-binding protein